MKGEEKAVLNLLLKMFQKDIAFLSPFALYTSLEVLYTPFFLIRTKRFTRIDL